jgi:hypothetical protein
MWDGPHLRQAKERGEVANVTVVICEKKTHVT